MAIRKGSVITKKQMLSVCVRMFLEQGYQQTTVRQIAQEAGMSVSSFQNFFHSKSGVLIELVGSMFGGQFAVARAVAGEGLPPVYVYAVETSIQLALTEMNENLREIYIEAYSLPETTEFIYQHTAKELREIFGQYFPGCDESDFYEMEIGTAGLMRGYMARPCDIHFPLRKKLECFLKTSLRVYRVSEHDLEKVLVFIGNLDIPAVANDALQRLFEMLEMKYDFHLSKDVLPERGGAQEMKDEELDFVGGGVGDSQPRVSELHDCEHWRCRRDGADFESAFGSYRVCRCCGAVAVCKNCRYGISAQGGRYCILAEPSQ